MPRTADIVRCSFADAVIAHCRLPAWQAGEWESSSNPSSIALSFTAQRRATIQTLGRRRVERNIGANSYGIAGPLPLEWIRVREPSECIEVTASPRLRASLAEELHVASHADLDQIFKPYDPIVWMLATRLRAIARSDDISKELALEECVLHLYRRVLMQCFGGREDVRGDGTLGASRSALVFEWIDAHLDRTFTIAQLASAASLTTSHFIRSFKRTVGTSPHQYVRARRLERAHEELVRGTATIAAAHRVGFTSISQFRNAFRRQFGYTPSETPRRGGRVWVKE